MKNYVDSENGIIRRIGGYFSGFISKDAILAGTLSYYFDHGGMTLFLPVAGFGAAAITAFYMFRLIFMTFYGKPKNP